MPVRRVAALVAWRVTPLAPGQRMDRSADKTARWHRGSAPIVYASSTPELAALEALAHLQAPLVPHALLRLTLRDVHLREVRALPPDWKARKPLTRDLGDDWLVRGSRQPADRERTARRRADAMSAAAGVPFRSSVAGGVEGAARVIDAKRCERISRDVDARPRISFAASFPCLPCR